MQNPLVSAGVTQFNGMKPKESLKVGGLDWKLRRDATDSSTMFPHQRVHWINAGCEPLNEGSVNYCWIMGIIPPNQGTLEKPVNVMYIGFHPHKITIAPNMVVQADLDNMHVYVSDAAPFAFSFVSKFLGVEEPSMVERATISPWPAEKIQSEPVQAVSSLPIDVIIQPPAKGNEKNANTSANNSNTSS